VRAPRARTALTESAESGGDPGLRQVRDRLKCLNDFPLNRTLVLLALHDHQKACATEIPEARSDVNRAFAIQRRLRIRTHGGELQQAAGPLTRATT